MLWASDADTFTHFLLQTHRVPYWSDLVAPPLLCAVGDEAAASSARQRVKKSTHLDREDLDGDVLSEQLGLPDAAKAPPSFDLQQLQRLLAQDGGGGQRAGVLEETARTLEGRRVTTASHSGQV